MKKYIVYDVETGGLHKDQHSLLTAYFKIIDQNFNPLDSLSLKIKPSDGTYHVTSGALKVNKIDLVKHNNEAITTEEARPKLIAFLSKHSASGEAKLTPVGHNVSFDEGFVEGLLENPKMGMSGKDTWEMYVSYRRLDTSSLAEALRLRGVIPASVSGSLGNLAQFFGIDSSGAHDAQVDVDMTVDLLRAMLRYVTRPTTV